VSAYYYLKIARAMLLEEPASAEPVRSGLSPAASLYLTLIAAALFAAGLVWNPLVQAAEQAARPFVR
jgi:NADH-quinone oxidoreductase subunit N